MSDFSQGGWTGCHHSHQARQLYRDAARLAAVGGQVDHVFRRSLPEHRSHEHSTGAEPLRAGPQRFLPVDSRFARERQAVQPDGDRVDRRSPAPTATTTAPPTG